MILAADADSKPPGALLPPNSEADMLFTLKKLLSALITPPLLCLLPLLLGLLLWRRRPRSARLLAGLSLLLWLVLSTPLTVNMLAAPLEDFSPISAQALRQTQAIVILGGGQRRYNEEYDGAAGPNRVSQERVRYGARLARSSGLPVLISGGAPTGSQAESSLMGDSMAQDFGVRARWLDTRSLDTPDNARESAQILREAGITRITLVTHAFHMRRALGEFERVGLQVTPAPLAYLRNGPRGESYFDVLPNMDSLYAGSIVLREWLGIAAQRIRFALS